MVDTGGMGLYTDVKGTIVVVPVPGFPTKVRVRNDAHDLVIPDRIVRVPSDSVTVIDVALVCCSYLN